MPSVPIAGAPMIAVFAGLAVAFGLAIPRGRQARRDAWKSRTFGKGVLEPTSGSSWPRACVCIVIGGMVPIGAFFFAWLASQSGRDGGGALPWIFAFVTSVVAMSRASSLASELPSSRRGSQSPSVADKPPAFDPESFEPIGDRG